MISTRPLMLLIITAVALVAGPARAQCQKDTDCKGERICQGGICTDPGPSAARPPAPLGQPGQQPGAADEGWAMAGAVVGFVGAGLTLSLAGAAEATLCEVCYEDERWTPIGLGAGALVTMLVTGPIAAAGAASARRSGAPGNLGLRIAAWVCYGVVAADGIAMIALGAAEEAIPHGLPIAAGVLGAGGLIMFAVDGLLSRSQAQARARQAQRSGDRLVAGAGDGPRPHQVKPIWSPFIAPGRTGGLLGVLGVF